MPPLPFLVGLVTL